MSAQIILSNGMIALVDHSDLVRVSHRVWHAHRSSSARGGYYVRTRIDGRLTYLHRFIMGAVHGAEVDHINRDGLDNRRANLRPATRSQNLANTRRSSKYPELLGLRGVDRQRSRWRARFDAVGVHLRGPTRATPIEAALDYDRFAERFPGEFATLNFPCLGTASA